MGFYTKTKCCVHQDLIRSAVSKSVSHETICDSGLQWMQLLHIVTVFTSSPEGCSALDIDTFYFIFKLYDVFIISLDIL